MFWMFFPDTVYSLNMLASDVIRTLMWVFSNNVAVCYRVGVKDGVDQLSS